MKFTVMPRNQKFGIDTYDTKMYPLAWLWKPLGHFCVFTWKTPLRKLQKASVSLIHQVSNFILILQRPKCNTTYLEEDLVTVKHEWCSLKYERYAFFNFHLQATPHLTEPAEADSLSSRNSDCVQNQSNTLCKTGAMPIRVTLLE